MPDEQPCEKHSSTMHIIQERKGRQPRIAKCPRCGWAMAWIKGQRYQAESVDALRLKIGD